MLFGSIESGGTKFVCAIGDENNHIIDQKSLPTMGPKETLQATIDYFKQFKDIKAFGISSFGPIDSKEGSKTYGYITNTPKPHWQNVNFLGTMKKVFNVPMAWTTDVNGSAYGEYNTPSNHHQSVSYLTFGTGVGEGSVIDGKFVGAVANPEMGHIVVRKHKDDVDFKGTCIYHGDCLEGLASGPSIQARTHAKGEKISRDNPIWDRITYYAAQAALQLTLMIRPHKIVFGGGVANNKNFLKKVRQQFKQLMHNYVDVGDLNNYLVQPSIANNGSATIGDFELAKKAFEDNNKVKNKVTNN